MKNTVLKVQAYICLIIWTIAACTVDSDSWIPTIIVAVVTAWLTLFAYANDRFEGYC